MSSDVVLTAALRNNLLSLQSTQNLIDDTQLRLATGRKVNSALDNPQNFFAAQSLNNRADDLNRLLDGIGQSITAIEQTDTALASLTSLVDQADSIAQQARDALASGTAEAKLTGERDVSGFTDLVTDVPGVTATSELQIQLTDPSSTTAGALVDFDDVAPGIQDTLTIDFNAGESIEEIVTRINDNNNISSRVVEARLDESGQLEIKSLNGGDLSINFVGDNTDAENTASNQAFASALGYGNIAATVSDGTEAAGAQQFDVLASSAADASLSSVTLFNAAGNVASADDSLVSEVFTDTGGATNAIAGFDATSGDSLIVGVNGTIQTIGLDNNGDAAGGDELTIQGFVDGINNNTNLNTLIEASFDAETGQLNIRSISSDVDTVEIGVRDDVTTAQTVTSNLGLGVQSSISSTAATIDTDNFESIRLGAAADELATLESEYDSIRTQIDALIADSGYRSTNLLNGDDLTTFFNEDRSNSLTTEGAILNTAGLGIAEANFGSVASVDGALGEIRSATLQIREFNASIANDLAVLQTRQDFTNQTINNLTAGADKLTIADQNEEGANLLALQTRQQLGVTSLSLASQSQQAVLRLF